MSDWMSGLHYMERIIKGGGINAGLACLMQLEQDLPTDEFLQGADDCVKHYERLESCGISFHG